MWQRAIGGDQFAVDRVLRLMERECRLLGADAPVKVALTDGRALTGRVTDSDDERATLDVDGTSHEVSFDEVAKAKVQIEFSRNLDKLDHRKD